MKRFSKFFVVTSVILSVLFAPVFDVQTAFAENYTATTYSTYTGYTKASDVDYQQVGKNVVNWGAREEDCIFLSTYAQNFYTGNYAFSVVSKKKSGSSQSNANSSELFYELSKLINSKVIHTTSYGETKSLFRYTDCEKNDYKHISSFYSGKQLNGNWDESWNREHTWPDSKSSNGTGKTDIMMLRPTWKQENSSRGNTAFGESRGYYHPNAESNGKYDLRGDCARICLYVYTRYKESRMWGKDGVMENLTVLLNWMENDPVDTWEMGRNDAVQSILGTRNVFVDYPEYAWLLFGKEIPKNMNTPSGIANGGNPVIPNPDPNPTPNPNPDPDTPVVPEASFEELTSAPEVNTAYKMAFNHDALNGLRYVKGNMKDNKPYMLDITNDPSSASDFFVEKADNGYYLYTNVDGKKVYLGIEEQDVNGKIKGSIVRSDAPQIALKYYDTVNGIKLNTLGIELSGNTYFFGCHGNNEYITIHDVNFMVNNPDKAPSYIARLGIVKENVNPNPDPTPNPNPDPNPDDSNSSESNDESDAVSCNGAMNGNLLGVIALIGSLFIISKRK